MKNITLSILVVACGALTSCGPSNYAANGNGGYVNSIYYTSSDAETSTSEQPYIAQNVTNLKQKTTSTYNPVTTPVETVKVDTIYMGDENVVNVDYQPGTQYVVVDGDESYEVLLRKFDSPTYVVNVNIDPWDYAWYGASSLYWGWPSVYGSRYGWHSPLYWRGYWGWNWRWYDPWFLGWSSWYDPWYYSWRWYDPWYYGYYDHWYWGHRDHWRYDHGGGYYPGHRPGHRNIRPGAHRSDPGRYYTRRNGIGSSRPGRPNSGVASKGNVNPRPTVANTRANGSSYRRNTMNQVRGTSVGRPQYDGNRNNGNRNASGVRSGSGVSTGRVNPSSSTRTNVVGRSNNVRPATMSRGNVSSRSTMSGRNGASYSTSASNRGSYTPSSRSNSGNRTTVTRPGSSVSRPGSANRSSSGGGVYRPASNRASYSSGGGSRATYSGGRSYSTSSPRSGGYSSGSGYSGGNSGGGYSSSSSGRSSGGSYSGGGSSHSSGGSSHSSGGSSSRSGGSSTRR